MPDIFDKKMLIHDNIITLSNYIVFIFVVVAYCFSSGRGPASEVCFPQRRFGSGGTAFLPQLLGRLWKKAGNSSDEPRRNQGVSV